MPITIYKIKSDQYKEQSYIDIVSQLKDKDGMLLNNDGLHLAKTSKASEFTEEELNARKACLDKCKNIVPFLVTKKKQHLIGSYQFKHVVENLVSEGYVSNGEIILVMISLGYSVQWYNTSVNCEFGCIYAKSDIYEAMRQEDEVIHHCETVPKF